LRQRVAQNDTIDTPIGSLPGVTISVGLARMRASDTLEDLVGRADKALYLAKARGRNRVCG
jgi:PleD family two-component response regulator